MNFLKKLFTRRPEDFIAKGDELLSASHWYDARCAYEDALSCCGDDAELRSLLQEKICAANYGLAELNVQEAGNALQRGDAAKAAEHLELAKSLTSDVDIREKAEKLLKGMPEKHNDQAELATHSSCSSCSHTSHDAQPILEPEEMHLDSQAHFELLIHQLPEEICGRYALLGEVFAKMYVAASQDRHTEALELLENWYTGADSDVYLYEKGKIQHHLGKVSDAERSMKDSIAANPSNPMPHLGLALLYLEGHRLQEALQQIDSMIAADIFTGQALMMRAEVFEAAGELQAAIDQYAALLQTPLAKAAAERLYAVLNHCGRQEEAAHVFKQYLKKCSH